MADQPAAKPPAKPPADDANPAAGVGAASTKPPAPPNDKTTDYLVFEATEVDDKGFPTVMKRVARVEAEGPKEARWAAVDANEDLKARADADAAGDAPLLLPITSRWTKPTATREKKIVKHDRS